MRWLAGILSFVGSATLAFGQQTVITDSPPIDVFGVSRPSGGLPSAGNRNFPNFIGFMSDVTQSIDPRSLNQLWPVFGYSSVSPSPPLPAGDIQLYGAGLNLAITERLSIGLCQGGYAVSRFNSQLGPFAASLIPVANRDRDREGFLNLGGFAQYTLIEDVPNQFLLTAGLRFAVPTGEADVFQGHGPGLLAPYATIGKEFGNFHVLATAGYRFPIGGGDERLQVFYANVHFDYRVCGWIYPVVEVNSSFLTSHYDPTSPVRRNFFELDNFASTGNVVTLATGVNFVLVPDRLELGAVYTTPLATQRDFDFNGLIVKMVLRF
jgi:hypothetical protein